MFLTEYAGKNADESIMWGTDTINYGNRVVAWHLVLKPDIY